MLVSKAQFFCVLGWISVLILVSSMLLACSTSKENVLPKDGPTMQQIYQQHFGASGHASIDGARAQLATRSLEPAALDLAGYSRTAYNEIESIFPRLPNPTLVMYVFPHLAEPEAVPVPGYSTSFSMYERDHYALPGEVANHAR